MQPAIPPIYPDNNRPHWNVNYRFVVYQDGVSINHDRPEKFLLQHKSVQ